MNYRNALTVIIALVLLLGSWGFAGAEADKETKTFSTIPTIMLHKEGAQFVDGLMRTLVSRGYSFVTYHDLEESYYTGKLPAKSVIISIDDFGPYRIVDVHKEMISVIRAHGGVGVLGLVVTTTYQDEDWKYLQSLVDAGWELASHSKTHPLKGLPSLSNVDLNEEIRYVFDQIRANTTEEPISLVLPGGTYGNDSRIHTYCEALSTDATDYNWIRYVVGISGGKEIFSSPDIKTHYVGRTGVVPKDPYKTVLKMERNFFPQTMVFLMPEDFYTPELDTVVPHSGIDIGFRR